MSFLFENLNVYKKAMELVVKVYAFCGVNGAGGNRKLVDQLQRAVLSIPLNIAEGQGRIHVKEKKQYYYTARGSLYECLPLIQVYASLKILTKEQYEKLYDLMNEIGRMLAGLIKSVK